MIMINSTAVVSGTSLTPIPASVPATVNVPFAATTKIGSFYDYALSTTASAFTAVLDWGDGTTPSGGTVMAAQSTPPAPGVFDVEAGHTYKTAGSFKITIAVNDTSGDMIMIPSTAIASGPVLTPIPGLVAATVNVPIAATTTIGSFNDSDTTAEASDFTAVINWDDGHTSGGTVTGVMGSPGVFAVQGSNTYATAGNFKIGIDVTDMSGDTVMITSKAAVKDPAS